MMGCNCYQDCPEDPETRSTRTTRPRSTRRHPIRQLRQSDAGSNEANPTLTGRLSVFGFQTRNTRPEPIVYPYRQSITIFRPDPARSNHYPTKSRPDINASGQISVRSRRIRPDFGQISTDPIRFLLVLAGSGQILSPVINPKPTQINPKPTRPEPKNPTRSPGQFRVNFLFTRPIRVESGLGTNPTRGHP